MADNFRIVVLGDSVAWGQGLLENEKYDVLVAQALQARMPDRTVVLEPRLSHSGASIDAGIGNPAPSGEIPVSRLTIIEQCDSFTNAPQEVDLVLMDGGINDIGVDVILDPLALIPSLGSRTKGACHDRMLDLLNKIRAKFSKASCRIIVTGYYVILSAQSDPLGAARLLRMHNITLPPSIEADLDFLNPIVHRCEEFFTQSNQQLQQAVADAHDARIRFVSSGFTDANAVFAPNALLWGLDDNLSPQDPAASTRIPACNAFYPNQLQFLQRDKCQRASAGHPNVAGARQFANQILAAV